MGLMAAAPVLAHALDWRTRADVKQRMAAAKKLKLKQQTQAVTSELEPEMGEAVYKAAAYRRVLQLMTKRAAVEKLDLLDRMIRTRK
jgi:hypothetical protein